MDKFEMSLEIYSRVRNGGSPEEEVGGFGPIQGIRRKKYVIILTKE